MKKLLIITLLFAALSWSVEAHAATMSIVPSTTSVEVGDLVTARIVTNSQGVAINNAEATLRFPSDILSVMSVSKAGSIFSLWVEEPAFSNAAGTVSYNGGVPTPGFTGSTGTILTVTFMAKQAGTATLSLADGAVRANDGSGTDVLSGSSGTQITVVSAPKAVPGTPSTVPEEPSAPDVVSDIAVSSPTHPDQDAWYANPNPTVRWVLGTAESVQLIVDRSASAQPAVTYTPPIVEKTVTDLADGTWYFRIRAKERGVWTTVSSYRLNIDTEVPTIDTSSISYDASTGMVGIQADAHDAVSGISGYDILIDDAVAAHAAGDAFAKGAYRFAYGKPGTHDVTLVAIDAAGNRAEVSGSIVVPASSLAAPAFTVAGITFTLLHILIAMALLCLASLAIAALGFLRHARGIRPALERDVHRGFGLYRKELEKNLRILEKARETRNLTPEEAKVHKRMLQNLADLERYIAERVDAGE